VLIPHDPFKDLSGNIAGKFIQDQQVLHPLEFGSHILVDPSLEFLGGYHSRLLQGYGRDGAFPPFLAGYAKDRGLEHGRMMDNDLVDILGVDIDPVPRANLSFSLILKPCSAYTILCVWGARQFLILAKIFSCPRIRTGNQAVFYQDEKSGGHLA
jgi:hypothetical protein